VTRRDVHRSFFDYAPIGKRKLFREHPVCQRISVQAVLSCGKLNDGRLPDGEMAANLEERDLQAVHIAAVFLRLSRIRHDGFESDGWRQRQQG